MKIRTHAGIATALAAVMMVTGCQSPTGTPASSEAPGKKQEATETNANKSLKLMIPNYYNDLDKKQWSNLAAKFQELNPDIKLEITNGDMQVENGKLTTMLQSGVTPPDALLINAGAGRVKVLADANLIQPLDDVYKQNKWQDQLIPFAYNLVSGNQNIYELPHTMDALMVYYHKDIFEKHGIKEPKTKDEFMNALKTLKEAGVTPITVGARDRFPISWMFSSMLEAISGRHVMEGVIYGDGKWNSPEMLKSIEALDDWIKQGYISKDSISMTAADAIFSFFNKKSALGFYGAQIIVNAAENKLENNLGIFALPSFIDGQKGAPAGGLGTTWVIPNNAKNIELTTKWLNFVLSTDYTKTVMSDPAYNYLLVSKSAASTEPTGPLLKQAMEAVKQDSGYNPAVFIGPETKEAYFQNLQGIVGGLTTPKEAAAKIQEGKDKDTAAGYKITKK